MMIIGEEVEEEEEKEEKKETGRRSLADARVTKRKRSEKCRKKKRRVGKGKNGAYRMMGAGAGGKEDARER